VNANKNIIAWYSEPVKKSKGNYIYYIDENGTKIYIYGKQSNGDSDDPLQYTNKLFIK